MRRVPIVPFLALLTSLRLARAEPAGETRTDPAPENPRHVAAPVLAAKTDVLLDDQPLLRWSSRLEVRAWVVPRLELGAGVEVGSVLDPQELGLDGGLFAARARLGEAVMDVAAWAGARRWFDGAETLEGELALALYPASKARARIGASRADEMSTWRAISRHVQRDGGFAELELRDLSGISGALRGDVMRYSDDNSGVSLSGWLAVAVIEAPLRVDLGYAGAYRGSEASRWDPIASVYDPYFTPLLSFRHGPSAALSLRRDTFSLNASAHYALQASERDPSTIGYYFSRRETDHVDLRAGASVTVSDVVFGSAYRYLLESYYAAHALELTVHVPL